MLSIRLPFLLSLITTVSISLAAQSRTVADQAQQLLGRANAYFQAGEADSCRAMIERGINLLADQSGNDQNLTTRDTLLARFYSLDAALYHRQGNLPQAVEQQQAAVDRLSEKQLKLHWVAAAYEDLAVFIFHSSGQNAESRKYFEQAINRYQQLDEPAAVAECRRYLGLHHFRENNFSLAITEYEAAITLLEALPDTHPEQLYKHKEAYLETLSRCYLNLAESMLKLDDLHQVTIYMDRSQQLLLANQDEFPQLTREALENQARIYDMTGEHQKSIQTYQSIITQLPEGAREAPYRHRILCKIAQVYGRSLEDHVQEEVYWQRALALEGQYLNSSDRALASIYRELIRCYLNQGKLPEAKASLQRAQYHQQLSGNALEGAIIAFSEARVLNAYGQPESALQALDRGRAAFTFPPSSSLANIEVLRSMLLFEYYKQRADLSYLAEAEEWARKSLNTLQTFEDRTFQRRSYGVFYRKPTEMLLHCLFEKYRMQPHDSLAAEIFSVMEAGRARSIRLGKRWEHTFLESRYPESLTSQYLDLKKQRTSLLNRRFQWQRAGADSLKLTMLADSLLQVEKAYSEILRQMNEIAPFSVPNSSLSDTQQQLANTGQALIVYFAGDSTLFSMGITAARRVLYAQPVTPEFRDRLADFSNKVRSPRSAPEALAPLSWELYRFSLAPILEQLPEELDQLYLIPDGILTRLPWPALSTSKPQDNNFRTWPYLIRRYQLSVLSHALDLRSAEPQQHTSRRIACFAPEYPVNPAYDEAASDLAELTRDSFWNLPGAWKEVQAISTIYGRQASLLDRGLNKNAFKQEIPKYGVLHLAMHALPDFRDPSQAFLLFPPDGSGDERLTALEFNELGLTTDLCVLSACYSGDGPWQAGEGVVSLAYALRATGVRSVVSNAWAVADLVSDEVMIDFHRQLSMGLPADAALRKAQLDFLKDAAPVQSAHPFYWAGFQLYGTPVSLSGSHGGFYWWLLGGMIVVSILFFYRRSSSKAAA